MRMWAAGSMSVLAAFAACTKDFDQFHEVDLPVTVTSTTGPSAGGGSSGGNAGAGGVAAGGMGGTLGCDEEPDPPGGTCPAVCTGSCSMGNTVCVFDCDAPNSCTSATLSCPPGFACEVRCRGSGSCQGATVSCPSLYPCEVTCEMNSACTSTTITCSSGTCALICGAGNGVCQGANLACGPNTCTATCDDQDSPTVTCPPSCDCQPC